MINYIKLSDKEKQNLISKLYSIENKSFQDIAISLGTYANKIRRDAQKFKIPIRDKSEAQKNALQTGKHKHPTKGKSRDAATKSKIGASMVNFWDNMSPKELEKIKNKAKLNWENLSDDERKYIQQRANKAVRAASKDGSKLEKFILEQLLSSGYKVDFHKEQSLLNTKLQIDLFLPNLNIAIEVDGPSHFLPVWGEDTLNKNKQYDNKKTGLILGKGLVLIRIKQTKEFSKARASILYDELNKYIKNIENKFPEKDDRYIILGE
jgi:very-short-patch-repair endonuclease